MHLHIPCSNRNAFAAKYVAPKVYIYIKYAILFTFFFFDLGRFRPFSAHFGQLSTWFWHVQQSKVCPDFRILMNISITNLSEHGGTYTYCSATILSLVGTSPSPWIINWIKCSPVSTFLHRKSAPSGGAAFLLQDFSYPAVSLLQAAAHTTSYSQWTSWARIRQRLSITCPISSAHLSLDFPVHKSAASRLPMVSETASIIKLLRELHQSAAKDQPQSKQKRASRPP